MKKFIITLLLIAFGNASLLAFAPTHPSAMRCANKQEGTGQHSSVAPEVSRAAARPAFNSNLMVPLVRSFNEVAVAYERIAFMNRPLPSPMHESARRTSALPKPQESAKKKSIFSSTLFWVGVAALAGGGAFLLLSGGDDKKTSTVSINVTFPN